MSSEKVWVDIVNAMPVEFVNAEDIIDYDAEEELDDTKNDGEEVDDTKKDADYAPPGQRNKSKVKAVEGKKRIALEVKKYPCIWDKQNRFYRNAVKREAAWSTVAKQMDTNGICALFLL